MPSENIFRRHVSLLKLNADEPYRQEQPIRQTLRLSASPIRWRFRATICRFCRRFGDFGGVFVTDFTVQRSNQHQGMVQEIVDFFRHGFDADGAVFVEAVARVTQEADGLQEVVGVTGI